MVGIVAVVRILPVEDRNCLAEDRSFRLGEVDCCSNLARTL